MSAGSACLCLLCRVEIRLLEELRSPNGVPDCWLSVPSERLRHFPSIQALLAELKSSHGNPRSDELFRELFAARSIDPRTLESVLILVFLPVLHGTVRQVAKHRPGLSPDDIAQQALKTFLEFLRSAQLQARVSHFAFAISRAVKRHMFEWASREGSVHGHRVEMNADGLGVSAEDSFERHALLRLFLSRCVSRGLLTGTEVDLLVRFKLEEANGEPDDSASNSSNAVRQKLKRLLAKLRRLAQ